jgi:hypothetical protein
MKWFFLLFLGSLGVGLNAFAMQISVGLLLQVFTFVGVNMLTLALLSIWAGAYVVRSQRQGLFVFGHAGVYLTAALGLIGLGLHSLYSQSCSFLSNGSSGSRGLIARAAEWSLDTPWCPALGAVLIGAGCFTGWPSARLVVSSIKAHVEP